MLTTIVLAASLFVIDGDTFEIAGERVRIANIDAPETLKPKCEAERMLGKLAHDKLKEIIASKSSSGANGIAKRTVTLERQGTDELGRTLALVKIGPYDVGERLLAAGVAVPWTGKQFDWCGKP